MKAIILLALVTSAMLLRAQSTHDLLIGGGLDLLKTDNNGLFKKSQLGIEANYFVVRHFAVGLGGEYWSNRLRNSFVLGARWYANDQIFIRLRGLIGANDAALGVGYAKAISKFWRIEGIGDFYLTSNEFALRGGIGYIIR